MIKEIVPMVRPDCRAYDVADEWAVEMAKCFCADVVPNNSFYASSNQTLSPSNSSAVYGYCAKIKDLLKKTFPELIAGSRFRRCILKSKIENIRKGLHPDNLKQDINMPLSVCFVMVVSETAAYRNYNCLPIFGDVWQADIKYVANSTKSLKLFYVTSRDVYDLIKAEMPNSNVRYMPLSVADKYYSPDFVKYRKKTIDVIQFGRTDPLLHEYMLRYADEHKDIDYVYAPSGKYFGYVSSARGNIGEIVGRDAFIKTLASAKVSLISSSGINKYAPFTYGIRFATPRCYESAIFGCALIGRYPDNQEFRELNMSRYCPNITSYDQFVRELERALAIAPEELYAQNRDFILNSLTSKRAAQIQKDLEELTCQNS